MSCHVWAPELHWLDGAWYLYFAAGDIDDVWNIRPYVLRCEGGDPLTGTWREEGLPGARTISASTTSPST